MNLQILWFVIVAFFWGGYFLLEGFDFGVGMLLPFLPRNEDERGVMFRSIGPVWDGNETWLVVAGNERQQHPHAEVEALEQEVAGPEDGDEAEPEGLEIHQYDTAGTGSSSPSPASPGGSILA